MEFCSNQKFDYTLIFNAQGIQACYQCKV